MCVFERQCQKLMDKGGYLLSQMTKRTFFHISEECDSCYILGIYHKYEHKAGISAIGISYYSPGH